MVEDPVSKANTLTRVKELLRECSREGKVGKVAEGSEVVDIKTDEGITGQIEELEVGEDPKVGESGEVVLSKGQVLQGLGTAQVGTQDRVGSEVQLPQGLREDSREGSDSVDPQVEDREDFEGGKRIRLDLGNHIVKQVKKLEVREVYKGVIAQHSNPVD